MKITIVWLVCGLLSLPLVAKVNSKPIYLGMTVVATVMGPITLALATGFFVEQNYNVIINPCIANCGNK